MPIKFECSDCGTALKVKEQLIGRKIRCPHCEAVNRVPAENGGSNDGEDEVVSRLRSSSASSRSKQSQRSQPRRSRANDDGELEELPLSPR
jgi:DNA-directed RNA polymerase subunit M/transcription elongation factor TFIIS